MTEEVVKSSIQVITRMMQLLDALAAHPTAVSLKLLATETGLHPSTAHRILNAMVRYRMVERVEPGTYRLGPRLHELGALVVARNGRSESSPPEPPPSLHRPDASL